MCSFDGIPRPLPAAMPPPPAAVLARTMDLWPQPLLLLGRDAALLHANLAGRRFLQYGGALKLDDGWRVRPTVAANDAAFSAALFAVKPVSLQWPPPSSVAPGRGACSIELRSLSAGVDGPLVVVLAGGAWAQHADVDAFARLHSLSAGQARVLASLNLGRDVAETAAALGIEPATVRCQLSRARRKSGYSSAATLLRALASMPPQPQRADAGE